MKAGRKDVRPSAIISRKPRTVTSLSRAAPDTADNINMHDYWWIGLFPAGILAAKAIQTLTRGMWLTTALYGFASGVFLFASYYFQKP